MKITRYKQPKISNQQLKFSKFKATTSKRIFQMTELPRLRDLVKFHLLPINRIKTSIFKPSTKFSDKTL